MNRAFVCRYSGTSIYELLGRDPVREPLSALELAIFVACLENHVVAERKPFVELGLPPPEKNG